MPNSKQGNNAHLVNPVDLSLSKFIMNRGRPVTLFSGTPSQKTIALAFRGEELLDPQTLQPMAEALESGFYALAEVFDTLSSPTPPEHCWLFAGQVADYPDIVRESLAAIPEESRETQREALRFVFLATSAPARRTGG